MNLAYEDVILVSLPVIRSSYYRYLRVGMLNRWNVLNAFHTYPHMLRCLRV